MSDDAPDSLIPYDEIVQEALRAVVGRVLGEVEATGQLPGDHHFFITFKTGATGVDIPRHLSEKFPDEMTIVIQNRFWDLKVSDDGFEVGLSFNQMPARLVTHAWRAAQREADAARERHANTEREINRHAARKSALTEAHSRLNADRAEAEAAIRAAVRGGRYVSPELAELLRAHGLRVVWRCHIGLEHDSPRTLAVAFASIVAAVVLTLTTPPDAIVSPPLMLPLPSTTMTSPSPGFGTTNASIAGCSHGPWPGATGAGPSPWAWRSRSARSRRPAPRPVRVSPADLARLMGSCDRDSAAGRRERGSVVDPVPDHDRRTVRGLAFDRGERGLQSGRAGDEALVHVLPVQVGTADRPGDVAVGPVDVAGIDRHSSGAGRAGNEVLVRVLPVQIGAAASTPVFAAIAALISAPVV